MRHIRLIVFGILISTALYISSCNHKPDQVASVNSRWEMLNSRAKGFRNTNIDSTLFYARILHREALKANDPRWSARALVLLGFYNSQKGENDSSIIFLQTAIKIADSVQDSITVEQAHNLLGSRYLGTGLYLKAEKEYLTGLKYAKGMHDTTSIIKCYNNLGTVAENLDRLGEAQNYINQALSMSEKRKDTLTMASSLRNLAYVLKKSGDSSKELDYFRASLRLFRLTRNARWTARLNSDLGIYYRYLSPDSSLYFYNKAIEIYKALGEETTVMINEFNKANLLFDKKDYHEAEKIFLEIYNKTLADNNLIGQAYSSFSLASTYLKLNDLARADSYAEKAGILAARWKQPEFTQSVYSVKIDLYKAEGKYKDAVTWYEKYLDLKDSLSSAENKTRILELQNKFDNQKKEFEITSLKQQTAIQQAKLRNRSITIISLSILVVVITFLFFVIVYFYRKSAVANSQLSAQTGELKKEMQRSERVQKNLTENEQKLLRMNATKDKFFSIIAHDLKSPFNTIFGFTDVLTTDLQEFSKEEIMQFLGNISSASKQAYALLENLLIWAQTQNKSLEFSPEALNLQQEVENAVALVDSHAITKHILITLVIDARQWILADRNMLATILRNLLTNAIKFSNKNDRVIITSSVNKGKVEISVQDNGVGIDSERLPALFRIETSKNTLGTEKEKGSGLGLILCREFAEIQGGKIWVTSEYGKGSVFTFSVPLAMAS